MSGIPDHIVGTPIRIVSSSSEMVLDTQVPVPAPGVPIILNPQSEGPSQHWRITPAGDDGFVIVSEGTSVVPVALDVRDASRDPGAPIILNIRPVSGEPTPSQHWRITPAGDDGFTILGASSEMALDVQGASRDPGTPIVQNPPRPGTSSQIWRLVPVFG